MPYSFYFALHMLGIFLTVAALGGAAFHAINGGTRETNKARGMLAAMHGVGLTLIFVAGFGMMAKIGIMGSWPHWILGKIVIWLFFGASIVVFNRVQTAAKATLIILILLGAGSGYLAKFKPGQAAAAPAAVEATADGSN
jgi:hypothetical protein